MREKVTEIVKARSRNTTESKSSQSETIRLIRVIIADDHPVVRAGLSDTLSIENDIEVIGDAQDGIEAVEKAKELEPDIVLMDLRMPRLDGVGAMRLISQENPKVKVIVLTTYDNDEYIFEGIEAGAKAYLLKDCPTEELLKAIRTVYKGGSLFEPKVAGKLASRYVELSRRVREPGELSLRESEILLLMARGISNKDIALRLSLSQSTVKAHISNIFSKMGVDNRAEAVTQALRRGIISP